jgi:phosphoesterase RecJ-like protein
VANASTLHTARMQREEAIEVGSMQDAIPTFWLDALAASRQVAIIPHDKPDADAVGSALGLKIALEQHGKRAAVLTERDVADNLLFLPEFSSLLRGPSEHSLAFLGTADLVVICDTHEPTLLTTWMAELEKEVPGRTIIVVDHHAAKAKVLFRDAWIDPTKAATAQMLFDLMERLEWPITSDIATCLLAGILGDTYQFSNTNTNATVLHIAAELVACGADIAAINALLFSPGRIEKVRLWGKLLNSMQSLFEGRVVAIAVTQRLLEAYGVEEKELSNLSNYLKFIRGVQIAVVFVEEGASATRVSLRSQSGYNVAAIAKQVPGGGGHPAAAGCLVPLPLRAAKKYILEKIATIL